MAGMVAFIYGVVAYVIFLVTFFYLVGFVANLFVPKSIDSAAEATAGQSLLVNVALLLLFAVQHSVMARKGFKKWWTKMVPAPIERSTYVLISSLFLLLLFWQWQPMPQIAWEIGNPTFQRMIEALFWIGWLIAIHSTFLIDHSDFFGLRQVYLHMRRREYNPPRFKMPDLYLYTRHPVMMGLVIAFWATPVMTSGHLLFAVATTVYILIGIQLEERDLMDSFGEAYKAYQRRVSMIIPLPRRK